MAVRIGELAGVDADALLFGFECLVNDTGFEPLELEIQSVPRMQRCHCGNEFRMIEYDPRCPACGEFVTQLVSGDQLEIAYMEVEE